MTANTAKLQRAFDVAIDCLGRLEEVFNADAKLTIIARFEGKPAQDFLVSDDDLYEVIALLQRRQNDPQGITLKG